MLGSLLFVKLIGSFESVCLGPLINSLKYSIPTNTLLTVKINLNLVKVLHHTQIQYLCIQKDQIIRFPLGNNSKLSMLSPSNAQTRMGGRSKSFSDFGEDEGSSDDNSDSQRRQRNRGTKMKTTSKSTDSDRGSEPDGILHFNNHGEEWQYLKNLSIEEKRKLYTCSHHTVLSEVNSWSDYALNNYYVNKLQPTKAEIRDWQCHEFVIDTELNERVSLFTGDITSLEIDCIVNAANTSLLGGGGVDGAIHKAAGPSLRKECILLNGCDVGQAKITNAYRLPCHSVIHTVGPMDKDGNKLRECYLNSMELAIKSNQRTIAFPCISTGVYGFPNEAAVKIALETIKKKLFASKDKIDRIIFCLFMDKDIKLYNKYMQAFFPVAVKQDDKNSKKQDYTEPEEEPEEESEEESEEDIVSDVREIKEAMKEGDKEKK